MTGNDSAGSAAPQPRRNFLFEFWSCAIGGVVMLFPCLAGLAALVDPLRRGRKKGALEYVPVTTLAAIPDDGVPRQFPVIKDIVDAWTFSPNERVGAVYLARQPGAQEVQALNVVCPHAGCFVGLDRANQAFQCPCHSSRFDFKGEIIRPSPSPRNMDELGARVTGDGTIEVAFLNYYPGKKERIKKR